MSRTGSNENDLAQLAQRLEKLESEFTLFVTLLDRKTTRLLYRSHTHDLNSLLHDYETTEGADGTQSLCEALRRIEGDKEQPREIRLICSLLLITVELKESAREAGK